MAVLRAFAHICLLGFWRWHTLVSTSSGHCLPHSRRNSFL